MSATLPEKLWNAADLIQREIPKAPCWIEPSILPKGGKMLFGGHAKIGKSLIMLELARSLALGKRPFECPHIKVPEKARVLVIDQELGEWGVQERLKKIMEGDPEEVLREYFFGVSKARDLRLENPDSIRRIVELCQALSANVLILDPIGKMHSYDENDASQINRLMNRLDEIIDKCKDTGLSIIFSHHFGKPIRDPRVELTVDQLFTPYNFRGSTRWYDDPDTLVTCNKFTPRRSAHKWWRIVSRWECRQGLGPPEFITFTANKRHNLRVEYEKDGFPAD